MFVKRRLYAPGSPPCTLLFVVALTVTGCVVLAYESFFWGNAVLIPRPHSVLGLPPGDEWTLIDLRNFRFVLNHDPCMQTHPLLVMLIHSAPGNLLKRMVIRETWGQRGLGAIVLFFVGTDDQLQNKLEEEDRDYGDIVQGNFKDAYRNMTYKHVMALKWATYYCPGAKYVLKLDDDVFAHTPAILEYISHGLAPQGAKRLILCSPVFKAVVQRSSKSKWRVSTLEYSEKFYPDYCSGWAILYSSDSVFRLYREAQKESYFWIDDVHITGTLARNLNLTHTPLKSLILTQRETKAFIRKPSTPRKFLFGPAELAEKDIRALWKAVVSINTGLH